MNVNLAVIGQGAVSPAGIGLDALLYVTPHATQAASLGQPDRPVSVLRVDLKNPTLARWQSEPRLRRASAMTYFLVEAAEQALAGITPAARAETGLIVAFSAGCLAYSRRFFEGIVKQGQRSASPALFPETVFNSPISHVASVLRLNGAAYALVGDETAWIAALKTAAIWLRQGRVRQVLVLGAEEFDPLVLDAYQSAGWLGCKTSPLEFMASEGAAGLLVSLAEDSPGAKLRLTQARDGLIYRNKAGASTAAERLLRDVPSTVPLFLSAGRTWLGSVERKATKYHFVPPLKEPYLGEAFTASAAWNSLRALVMLGDEFNPIFVPVWGLNHQLGLLECRRDE